MQATKELTNYAQAFERLRERTKNAPQWLKRMRECAFERFEETGFPTTRQEDWKYTNVSAIAKANFEAAQGSEASKPKVDSTNDAKPTFDETSLASFVYAEAAQSRVVFVNGVYRKDLSSRAAVPPQVAIESFANLFADGRGEEMREYLNRAIDANANGFTLLNTAFLENGIFIRLPKNVAVDAPIHIAFITDEAAENAAQFPRIVVVAEEGSSLALIESYAGAQSKYLTNASVEIYVAENARVVHYKVQRESDAAFHYASTGVKVARAAAYDSTTVTLGAELSRHDIRVEIEGEGAECWVDGLYLVSDAQHTDTHSLIDHQAPNCQSHQLYKGILDDKARGVFNGRIFVHRAAQRTDAYQKNQNLLLSGNARVDTKPQLEIFADDVKCSHGATVGQLEEEELFYLLSRGLTPKMARNLLTYGFAEAVVEKIKIESIKRQLNEAILNRLHAEQIEA